MVVRREENMSIKEVGEFINSYDQDEEFILTVDPGEYREEKNE